MSQRDLPDWAQKLPRGPRVALLFAAGFHRQHTADAAILQQLGSSLDDVSALAESLRASSLPKATADATADGGGERPEQDGAPWIVRLRGALHSYDSVHQVGGEELAWRSHRHAWYALSCDLTATDVHRLQAVVLDVLPRPRPGERQWGETIQHPSPRILDGLAESLALLGSSDDLIDPPALAWEGRAKPASAWADETVQTLLSGDVERWATLAPWLPLLAEAGPQPFLLALLRQLEGDARALWEHPALRGAAGREPLLFALQILGWDSALMPQVARCFLHLLTVDTEPHRAVHPRPLSCLSYLLGFARPQTNASPEQRLATLSELAHDPQLRDMVRVLLLHLWSEGPIRIHSPAARPRFLQLHIPVDAAAIPADAAYGQVQTYAELLMELAGHDAQHWADGLRATHVPDSLACKVLERLLSLREQIADPDGRIASALRGVKDWLARCGEPATSRPAFQRRRKLTDEAYARFTPDDPVARYAFLFAVRPRLDDGVADHSTLGQRLHTRRLAALREIWQREDRWDVLARLQALPHPPAEPDKELVPVWLALALVETPFADPLEDRLRQGEAFAPFDKLAPSFLALRLAQRDLHETDALLQQLVRAGRLQDGGSLLDEVTRIGGREVQIWNLLDGPSLAPLRHAYWRDAKNVWMGERPPAEQERAAERLLEAGNLSEALWIAVSKGALSGPLLLRVFEALAEAWGGGEGQDVWKERGARRHDILAELLKRLAAASDVDLERAVRAELRLFGELSNAYDYEPVFIARAISASPAWLAKRLADEAVETASEPLSDHIFAILEKWHGYPGDDRLRSEQAQALENWCLEFLRLLPEQRDWALSIVGTFLAQPRPDAADGLWPCRTARRFLDELIGDDRDRQGLMRSMEAAKWSERGATSRAIGEGGEQERELAAQLRQGAARIPVRYRWTRALLEQLAARYDREAQDHDQEAEEDRWRFAMAKPSTAGKSEQSVQEDPPAPVFPLSLVKMENFRALRALDLKLDPHLNVFIGRNASGKTTVLDAIAAGLAAVQDELFGSRIIDQLIDPRIDRTKTWAAEGKETQAEFLRLQYWGQSERSQRARQPSERTDRDAQPKVLSWNVYKSGAGGRGARDTGMEESALRGPLRGVKQALQYRESDPSPVPIFAYYGSKRAISAEVLHQEAKHLEDLPDGEWQLRRAAAYDDALIASAGYKNLVSWWRSMQSAEDELKKERKDFSAQLPALLAVRRVIEKTVRSQEAGGMRCRNPRTKGGHPGLVVDFQRGDGEPPETRELAQLSDGFRTHLALVMDLARRMVQANPPRDSDLDEAGWGTSSHAVVLIDEVELHLHPGWQRSVLKDLREAFPNTQFIVTTHSPQVIATVPRQHVQLLSEGRVIDNLYVEGRDSNALLEDVFGISSRPEEYAQAVEELFVLLDDEEKLELAREKLAKLEKMFSGVDADIVKAHWRLERMSATRARKAKLEAP